MGCALHLQQVGGIEFLVIAAVIALHAAVVSFASQGIALQLALEGVGGNVQRAWLPEVLCPIALESDRVWIPQARGQARTRTRKARPLVRLLAWA